MRWIGLCPRVSAGCSVRAAIPLAAGLIFFVLAGAVRAARPIPDDVAIRAFAKPAGDKLQLLVRVPFTALNGIEFPTHGESGYLDLDRMESILPGAARYWIADSVQFFEEGAPLPKPRVIATRAAVLSDNSFESFASALEHLNGPKLPPSTSLAWNQAWLDTLFEYPIRSDHSAFSVRPAFAHLAARVSTDFRFLPPGQPVRPFTFDGDPGLVNLAPGIRDVAARFTVWGFFHILNGTDYLLFLLCVVLPFRSFRTVIPMACAFAFAHSVTLIASALNQAPDALWFPPLIETAIAVTILYVALENIAGGVTPYRRSLISAIFGLFYGFSFAFGLSSKLQFAGTHALVSALAFNLGIEFGLIAALLLLVPALAVLLRFSPARRIETVVLSVLAAHTSWHWMAERAERLNRFHFTWPVVDAALISAALRWMMIFVIFSGVVWLGSGLLHQRTNKATTGPAA